MKRTRKSLVALLACIIYGAVFGLLTNIIFDDFISAVWTPLAIALYFFAFAGLLCLLIIIIVKKLKYKNDLKQLATQMAILLLAVFVSSMLFEYLYELGLNYEVAEPDSYILMIDDSSSMLDSDPNCERKEAINTLVADKNSDFKYSIYVFSSEVYQARDMQPKLKGSSTLDLKSDGGTAMFGCLEQVLSDIATGKLETTNATRVLLLSDGYAGDTPLVKSKLLKKYINNNLVISTIGLGSGVDEKTMEQIASYTGGVYIHVDDASNIDTAMIDAAIQTSTRNLLGFRGFCKTNVLHAVMRVVFLLIIIALIYVLKIYSYGKYYNPNLIVSCISSVIAGLLPEIALQVLSWNDNLVRVIFCVLVSVTLFEYIEVVRNTRRRSDDEYINNSEADLSASDRLSRSGNVGGDTGVSSLR